jgi:glycosyltransferase involved in cell wall biosynthesis
MMKILYDYQIFSMQRYGGISRYFANLHTHFKHLNNVQTQMGIKYSNNHYLQGTATPFNTMLGKLLSEHKIFKWNKYYSNQLLKQGAFDVFHPTYYHPYFFANNKKPYVITVHDMIHELFSGYFSPDDEYVGYKKKVIENAAHIIAISASTKADVQKLFAVPDAKISLVYHGFNKMDTIETTDFSMPFQDYILYVGDRKLYKNFNRFVSAVQPVLAANKNINLICTGGGAFTAPEIELLQNNNIKNRAVQLNVTDSRLHRLYQQALVFVFPSEYEGFGFPILEAFDAGCPVAVSNTSCFKEVGGDAVMYFDPYNIDEMTETISTVITNRQLTASLVEKGKKQLGKFTMEKCVAETLAVYKKLM